MKVIDIYNLLNKPKIGDLVEYRYSRSRFCRITKIDVRYGIEHIWGNWCYSKEEASLQTPIYNNTNTWVDLKTVKLVV